MTSFLARVSTIQVTLGMTKKLLVTGTASGSAEYTPIGLLDRFLISYPPELKDAIGGDAIILLYGQLAMKSTGPKTESRLAFIQEIKNPTAYVVAMRQWDTTIVTSMASLLGYTKNKNVLVDDTYSGVPFRYVQIPDNTLGLAYATVVNKYLVIASSKDSFRFIVDTLLSK